jgi:hypothetical protein
VLEEHIGDKAMNSFELGVRNSLNIHFVVGWCSTMKTFPKVPATLSIRRVHTLRYHLARKIRKN